MLKKVFRRLRKGVRDIGSFAKEHSGIANPELALLALTLGASGIMPGGKPFGLETLFGNMGKFGDMGKQFLGSFGKTITSPTATTNIPGSGILGTAQNIVGGMSNKDKFSGIASLVNSFLAKKALDEEKANELRKEKELKERMMLVSNKFGSELGGTPFLDEQIRGTLYNPEDGQTYDYYDYDTKTYKNFTADEEGRTIEVANGGIAKLAMGGNPNRMTFNVPVRRAMGGGTGVPGLTPDMSSNQMMNKIEEDPGITAFFPRKLGMIDGPGGPKDDKIPAMLSDGEFVFTAKAVDNAGGPKAMYNMMNKLDPESSKGKGII
tara:strand:- start:297 stop:1259 length:963 start_codon:yes stop_codon:yes gene_type:complete